MTPQLETITPREAFLSLGTSFRITGTDLDQVTNVFFPVDFAGPNVSPAQSFRVISPSEMEAAWAPNTTSDIYFYGVTLYYSPTEFNRFSGLIRVSNQRPRSVKISPTIGAVNTRVYLTGEMLGVVTRVDVGQIGPVPFTRDGNTMSFRIPPELPAGRHEVVLGSSNGTPYVVAGFFTVAGAVSDPCHRAAWLTLDNMSVPLEDDANGYVCAELDIGWPDIREVINNRPDFHGVDDRTRLFGARLVSARIVAGPWGARSMDENVRLFGPFLQPSARPVLHYTTETPSDDWSERTLVLRAATFSAPISGAEIREMHCAWVAADPIIRGAETRDAIARPYSTLAGGRSYPLTFDREYATGGAGGQLAFIVSPGESDVFVNVRLFGPIQAPYLYFTTDATPYTAQRNWQVRFKSTYRLDTLRFADIDTANHTLVDDLGNRLEGQIDWSQTSWSSLPGNNQSSRMQVFGLGGSTNHNTQALVTWTDGYVTP